MTEQQQRRVVADGWGGAGSVFCADSSLRFIYESQQLSAASSSARHPSAAALSSLSAASQVNKVQQQHQHHLQSQPQQHQHQHQHQHPTNSFMDQLKGSSSYYDATKGGVFPGKRPRENSVDGDGVDHYEADIARACTAITRRVPSLPHSYRECSVCLSENAYAQIALCGHTFHAQCFLRWFRTNRSCPLCRGPVDKMELAPVVTVQDDIEALMAGMDEEPLDMDAKSLVDPLMGGSDLMSFLDSDFDTDMNMAALDDIPAVDMLSQDMDMMDMDMDHEPLKQGDSSTVAPKDEPANTFAAQPPASAAAPMQFAPSSTMPNYWNVLNQGLSCIPPALPTPIAAPAPHSHHAPSQQRMVHIAPKPDTLPSHHLAQPSLSAVGKAAPSFQRVVHVVPPAAAPRVVSCRCTGGCRNGRCACVKEGGMCGVSCRCTSCKNPFLMVKAAGADIDALLQDSCFMHNVSKTRDMVQRLQEGVAVPCCGRAIKVVDCVQGFACAPCARQFDFSWCTNKLVDSEKTPRNHCDICKRCCDHRDVHCHDCGRCYFAGVATSLPCPCKEATHHKKRRENAEHEGGAAASSSSSSAKARAAAAADDDEEGDGECCIM